MDQHHDNPGPYEHWAEADKVWTEWLIEAGYLVGLDVPPHQREVADIARLYPALAKTTSSDRGIAGPYPSR